MTKFRFLALFAALALLLTVSTTVLAQQPKQPHVFTGEVMIGEEMAMDGAMVTATIDGETVGVDTVMDGMYTIKLDPGDPSAEGYMDFSGTEVMFMVGMEDAGTAMWMEGMVSPLNLMAMAMEPEPTEAPVMMPGPRGPQGRAGADGADGADGAPGADGRQGRQGPQGRAGADGNDGAPGADGRNGADGNDGADGSDGAPGAKGDKGDMGAQGAAGAADDAGSAGAVGGGGVLAIIGLIIAIVALVAAGGAFVMGRRG